MLDITKKFKTRNGFPVVGLTYVEKNSQGNIVSFPIKGTILQKKNNRTTSIYQIWTVEGKNSLIKDSNYDLILV